MKRFLFVPIILLWCSVAFGAAFTSTQSGNLNDGATWGNTSPGVEGTDYPGSGDTATFSSGHSITITATTAIGTGGAAGTDELIINGTVSLSDDVILTVRGDTRLNDGAALSLGAGSSWLVDDGNYEFEFNGTSTLTIAGTSGNRASFGADTGNYTWIDDATTSSVLNIDADYADISLGGGGNYGWDFHGNSNTQNINFNRCKLTLATRCDYANGFEPANGSTFIFTNCDFRGLPTSYSLIMGDDTAFNFTGEHSFNGCTFAGNASGSTILIRTGASSQWVINNNISQSINWQLKSPANIDYFAEYHDNGAQTAVLLSAAGGATTVDNSAIWSDATNAHMFDVQGSGGKTVTFTNNFSQASALIDNHYLPAESANQTVTLLQNITKNGNGVITRYASADVTVLVDRHTHWSNSALGDALYIVEAPEFTGSDTVRNSIQYSTGTSENIADGTIVTSTEMTYVDYNNYFDVAGAARYNNVTVSGKSLNDAGFGGSDVAGDPGFVGGGADFASWDTSLGGAGTVANAFAEMIKLNGHAADGSVAAFDSDYTVSAFISYIWTQYEPTSAALDGTGLSGVDIGAVDFSTASGGRGAVFFMGAF